MNFAKNVWGITEAATSHKRQKKSEKQKLQRFKIQKRFESREQKLKKDLESKDWRAKKKHKLEIHRLDLQEKKLKL